MLFFFFQAEDGIRDLYVTGVQTCALPISGPGSKRMNPNGFVPAASSTSQTSISMRSQSCASSLTSAMRSEERRVGKECRSRLVPEERKKNIDEAAERCG